MSLSPALSLTSTVLDDNILHDQFLIPQLDGLDSPPVSPQEPHQLTLRGHGHDAQLQTSHETFQQRLHHIRNTNFTLDKPKQVNKLRADSTIADFEVVTSVSGENINIYCNVGFYTKVAFPTFRGLTTGKNIFANVLVSCHDITERSDAQGASTTTVIIFCFSQDKDSLGGAPVHLHHTTRNVQIQGSALLPRNRKAPVWFVDEAIMESFKSKAIEHANDINQLNKTVSSLASVQPTQVKGANNCSGCLKSFNGRSAPEKCTECNLFYHKYKCFPSSSHPCHIRKRSQSCSTNELLVRKSVTAGITRQTPPPRSPKVPPATSDPNQHSKSTPTTTHIPPTAVATASVPTQDVNTVTAGGTVSAGLNEPITVLDKHHDSAGNVSPVTTTWMVPSSPGRPSLLPDGVFDAGASSSTEPVPQSVLDPNTPAFVSRGIPQDTNIAVDKNCFEKGKNGKSKNKNNNKNRTNNIPMDSIELEYKRYKPTLR